MGGQVGRRAQKHVSSPCWFKQVSPLANGTQRLETLEGVQRRWLQSDGSLCLQRRSCFGNCCLSQQFPVPTLCVCTQLHNPKRKSTSHDIPSVCRAEHSLGRKVLTRFLPIVNFPLLCFWMALQNHKNFLSCSVSSLWPQNETNQNKKQPDQREI